MPGEHNMKWWERYWPKKLEEEKDTVVVPEDQIITLDFLTNPTNK